MTRPDDLMDALVDKLGEVSPVWTQTFPGNPTGYKKLQKLVSEWGDPAVKKALRFALDKKIVPHRGSGTAMPVLIGILRAIQRDDEPWHCECGHRTKAFHDRYVHDIEKGQR